MLQFKQLTDPLEIKDYILQSKSGFADFSLGFLYMWRASYKFYYAVADETLVMGGGYDDGDFAYFYPVGKNVNGALDLIEKDAQNRKGLRFMCLDDETAALLCNRYENAAVTSDRRWSDYIYNAEDLKYFRGKKYAGQRNHINKFLKTFGGYTFKKIEKEDLPAVLDFYERFAATRSFGRSAKREFENSVDLTRNMFRYNCFGGCILVNGAVAAVAVGERVGDTVVEHIEKGLPDYPGIYQVMLSEFAKNFAEGAKYINREDDSGDEGLRTSKLQYHPVLVKNKNYLVVNCLFKKIKPPVVIMGEGVILSDLTAEDKEAFYRLYTDEENNRYWGYDYREDLGDAAPTPDYFFSFQQSLKDRCEEYSLAVRHGCALVGEAVFHNFDFHGGVEIGIRILKSEQKKGFAKAGLAAMIRYAKDILGVSAVRAKCFKENAPSKAALLAAGMKKTGADDTYYYFTA